MPCIDEREPCEYCYICNSCEEHIESADYNQSGSADGSYHISSEEHRESDCCFDGDFYQTCPNCGDEIDPDNLEKAECKEEKEKEEKEEELIKIKTPNYGKRLVVQTDNHRIQRILNNQKKCPGCKVYYEFDRNETEITCQNCDLILTK